MEARSAAGESGPCVTLGIDREVFAVPVEAVQEILAMRPVFRIPDAPRYLRGLIDVRGQGVPVIDLRIKLGLPAAPETENTRILVLEVPVSGRRLILGLVADRVFEVAELDDGQVAPPPDVGTRWRSDYIRGIGRRNNTFVVVLDLPRLFSAEEARLLDANSASSAVAAGAPADAARPDEALLAV
ncbi:MAG TPA: chemotaxis protein CheW [Xanthobacteraceae bacterium]|nr:chemotaxis protein CheW [Xanthobacteraceae bacterium]